jgi:hypothetical protein
VNAQTKMVVTGLACIYGVIGLFYAIYQAIWGAYSYKPVLYNFFQGVIWPLVMFPSFGKAVGGVVMVAVVLYIHFKR